MNSIKKPMLWDLVHGVTGTFMRVKEYQPGLVMVFYVPIGKFKEVQYPEAVPLKAIIRITPPRIDVPGVYPDLVVIKENAKGQCTIGELIGDILKEKLKEYDDQLEEQKIATMTQKHRAHSAAQETQKRVAQDMALKKPSQENGPQPFNRFGGLFGRPFNRNNEYNDDENLE